MVNIMFFENILDFFEIGKISFSLRSYLVMN